MTDVADIRNTERDTLMIFFEPFNSEKNRPFENSTVRLTKAQNDKIITTYLQSVSSITNLEMKKWKRVTNMLRKIAIDLSLKKYSKLKVLSLNLVIGMNTK